MGQIKRVSPKGPKLIKAYMIIFVSEAIMIPDPLMIFFLVQHYVFVADTGAEC